MIHQPPSPIPHLSPHNSDETPLLNRLTILLVSTVGALALYLYSNSLAISASYVSSLNISDVYSNNSTVVNIVIATLPIVVTSCWVCFRHNMLNNCFIYRRLGSAKAFPRA